MFQPCVYLALHLDNLSARKLYKLSKIKDCSIIQLVECLVEDYLEESQIDAWGIGNNIKSNAQEESDIRKKIGKKIAMLRQLNCLSQTNLGEAVNLDKNTISKIELGNRRLDIVEAVAIAQVLGVELNEII